MFYIGCLPLLVIMLLFMAVAIVRGVIKTSGDIVYGLYLTIREKFIALFRPTPTESYIDDVNYYRPTELRPKLYSKSDGVYTSFRKVKH